MTWFWTDDIARALIADGVVRSSAVTGWIARPIAVAGRTDEEPLAVGRRLLGLDVTEEAGAA